MFIWNFFHFQYENDGFIRTEKNNDFKVTENDQMVD